MSTRDGQMGAGLEAGVHMKKSAANSEKLLGKPLPARGTPPWPSTPERSAGGKFKFKPG